MREVNDKGTRRGELGKRESERLRGMWTETEKEKWRRDYPQGKEMFWVWKDLSLKG